jgi:LEA14-like dessication related protein
MKVLLASSALVLIIVFCNSCRPLREPEYRGIDNLRVTKLGLSKSTLNLDIHYYNPNKSRLKVKKAEGEAWIENNFLGRFSIDTLIHIPAKGDFRLPVKLEVDMSRIFGNSIMALLLNEVTVKVEGSARLGKGFVYINYPLRYTGKHRLKELMN